MASIKVDYEGIESDISTLTTNVKTICDSLDKINDIEKIVPSSWQSPASEKYRSTVVFDLIARIAELKGSLTLLINLLVSISDNFSNLEGIIGSDLKSWYDDLSKNNNILDILNKNPKFVSEGIIDNDAISLPTVDENGNIVYKKGEGKFSTLPGRLKIDENGKLVYDGPMKISTMPNLYAKDENGNFVQISTEINPDNGTLIDNGTLTTNKNPKFVSEGIIDNDAISLPTVDENGKIVYKKGEGKFSTLPGRLKIDENGKLVYDGPMKISTMPNLYAKDENGNFVQISTEINPDNGTLIDNGTLTTNKNPKFVSEGIIDNDAISLPTVDENGNIVYKKGEGKFSTMPSHFKIDESGNIVYEGGEGKFSTMPSHFKIDENGKLVYDGPKEFDTLDSTVSDVGESNNI